MDEAVIRPSMKLIRAGYTLVFFVIFACVLLYTNSTAIENTTAWVLLLPALLLLWPLRYHVRRSFTRMTLSGDKLRYETGILSRSKRIIQLTKVQDVRVDQSLVQRMLRTGNLSVETAGETSLLTMRNVDEPDRVAEELLRAAHGDGKT
jgi:membrane protein YdbS with pleckstrin-like domain